MLCQGLYKQAITDRISLLCLHVQTFEFVDALHFVRVTLSVNEL